jgi:hypothetical protein
LGWQHLPASRPRSLLEMWKEHKAQQVKKPCDERSFLYDKL